MNPTEKVIRDYNDQLEEPLKSFVQAISGNNEGLSDHRRANSCLKLHLVQQQVEALNRLSKSMDENSKANDKNSQKMFWLTVAIAIVGIVQAVTPFLKR